MQTDYLTQNPQVLSQRIHFPFSPETTSHSIFSLSIRIAAIVPSLLPVDWNLLSRKKKRKKKKLDRDGAPVQTVQPMRVVPQRQKVGQWWSRFCFSSFFLFMWGQTLPLTSLLTFSVTKGPSFYVCFLLYLLFKIEKTLWLCVFVSSKLGPQAKHSDGKRPPVFCPTTPTGLSHTTGLNLLQLRPCSQLLRQKPEAPVIVSYSLAVMCWPQRQTQWKRGVRYDRD